MNPEKAMLTGRVAIVTGGAEGIGNAIARCLAAFGADVVVPDINEDGARKVAAEIRGTGRRALSLQCDVTRQADVDRMMAATLREFGRVDVLINNVGGTIRKLFMEMAEREWYDMVELNLIQVFRCTQAAAKVMIEQEIRGSIVNLTTIEAYRGAPGYAPYAAAKAGLANFTKTMALELGPYGIRVNSGRHGDAGGRTHTEGDQARLSGTYRPRPKGDAGGLRRGRPLPGLRSFGVDHGRGDPRGRRHPCRVRLEAPPVRPLEHGRRLPSGIFRQAPAGVRASS